MGARGFEPPASRTRTVPSTLPGSDRTVLPLSLLRALAFFDLYGPRLMLVRAFHPPIIVYHQSWQTASRLASAALPMLCLQWYDSHEAVLTCSWSIRYRLSSPGSHPPAPPPSMSPRRGGVAVPRWGKVQIPGLGLTTCACNAPTAENGTQLWVRISRTAITDRRVRVRDRTKARAVGPTCGARCVLAGHATSLMTTDTTTARRNG